MVGTAGPAPFFVAAASTGGTNRALLCYAAAPFVGGGRPGPVLWAGGLGGATARFDRGNCQVAPHLALARWRTLPFGGLARRMQTAPFMHVRRTCDSPGKDKHAVVERQAGHAAVQWRQVHATQAAVDSRHADTGTGSGAVTRGRGSGTGMQRWHDARQALTRECSNGMTPGRHMQAAVK